MSHHRVKFGALSLALAASLSLSGCSSAGGGAPESAASPTASPTASPSPAAVATLQFSGSDVRALDSDTVQISALPFTEGADSVVKFVAATVGIEPTITEEVDEGCAGPHTQYQWDGVAVTAWTGSDEFIIGFTEPVIGGIRLESTGGFAPGDDVSDFSAAAPPANVGSMGGENTLIAFDVVATSTHGDYTSPVGAVGYAPDGVTLQSLMTPGEWSSFLC